MILPNIAINITANTVAWYGAVLGTIGAVISIHNFLKDRVKLKITFQPKVWLSGDLPGYDTQVPYFSISVINSGRRPVYIEQACFKQYGESGVSILTDSFSNMRPKLINEESPRTNFFSRLDRIDDIDRIYCFIVTDGTGNPHKKYVHHFPTFRRLWFWIKIKYITSF